jgi:serine/threonine protein kinase
MDLSRIFSTRRINAVSAIPIEAKNHRRHCRCDAVRAPWGAISRDLSPANILLVWDWTVRTPGFGHSASPEIPPLIHPDELQYWPSVDSRYLAPGCYDGTFRCMCDVFAFGRILFAILADPPAFPEFDCVADTGLRTRARSRIDRRLLRNRPRRSTDRRSKES